MVCELEAGVGVGIHDLNWNWLVLVWGLDDWEWSEVEYRWVLESRIVIRFGGLEGDERCEANGIDMRRDWEGIEVRWSTDEC